jgi:hypothetical protein
VTDENHVFGFGDNQCGQLATKENDDSDSNDTALRIRSMPVPITGIHGTIKQLVGGTLAHVAVERVLAFLYYVLYEEYKNEDGERL